MEDLVPGRECGSCNACCVVPVIDSPQFSKHSNTVCRHSRDAGCAVYETRPDVCRRFFCGWRRTKLIPDDWRPDRSGVFVTMGSENVPPQFGGAVGLTLTLTDNPLKTVRQPWFVDFVAGAAARRIPLFLSLPGGEGMQAAMVLLNGAPLDAALGKARAAVKDVLERALKQLAGHTYIPCVMTHEDAGAA